MAITTSFGYTNNTAHTKVITPVNVGVTTNYALIKEEPSEVALSNVTSPMDQAEIISYKASKVAKVSTSMDVVYPAANSTGVQYVIKVEDVLRISSDTDPSFKEDLPIVAYLTVRHVKSSAITDTIIGQVANRLFGASIKADGTFRFGDLARNSLKPKAD